MEMYRITNKWREAKIECIDVDRVTDNSVWYSSKPQRRRALHTEYYGHYPTWKEAHDALMHRATVQVAQAREALQRANNFLGNVKGMKEPQK